jgi:hypothetical protein
MTPKDGNGTEKRRLTIGACPQLIRLPVQGLCRGFQGLGTALARLTFVVRSADAFWASSFHLFSSSTMPIRSPS